MESSLALGGLLVTSRIPPQVDELEHKGPRLQARGCIAPAGEEVSPWDERKWTEADVAESAEKRLQVLFKFASTVIAA